MRLTNISRRVYHQEYIVFAKTCSKVGGRGGRGEVGEGISLSVNAEAPTMRCKNPKAILRLFRTFGSDFLSENFIPFINFPILSLTAWCSSVIRKRLLKDSNCKFLDKEIDKLAFLSLIIFYSIRTWKIITIYDESESNETARVKSALMWTLFTMLLDYRICLRHFYFFCWSRLIYNESCCLMI